ncbi:MAG: hypothetical protein ACTHK5_02565 [Tsuneonella sp.]
MTGNENLNRLQWLLRIAAFVVNAAAVVMLVLKLGFGRITNDDLIAIMLLAFAVNVVIAFVRRQKRVGSGE